MYIYAHCLFRLLCLSIISTAYHLLSGSRITRLLLNWLIDWSTVKFFYRLDALSVAQLLKVTVVSQPRSTSWFHGFIAEPCRFHCGVWNVTCSKFNHLRHSLSIIPGEPRLAGLIGVKDDGSGIKCNKPSMWRHNMPLPLSSPSRAAEQTQRSSTFPRQTFPRWPLQPPYALRPCWVNQPGDLDLWPWKWCPSRVWCGLPLCQFWSS